MCKSDESAFEYYKWIDAAVKRGMINEVPSEYQGNELPNSIGDLKKTIQQLGIAIYYLRDEIRQFSAAKNDSVVNKPIPKRSKRREREAALPEGIRKAMRLQAVLAATGWSQSTLYAKMASGKFPQGTKLDPSGQSRVWFEDEIDAFQRGEWKLEGK